MTVRSNSFSFLPVLLPKSPTNPQMKIFSNMSPYIVDMNIHLLSSRIHSVYSVTSSGVILENPPQRTFDKNDDLNVSQCVDITFLSQLRLGH